MSKRMGQGAAKGRFARVRMSRHHQVKSVLSITAKFTTSCSGFCHRKIVGGGGLRNSSEEKKTGGLSRG